MCIRDSSCSLASSLVSCKARPSRSRRVRGVEASVAGGLSYGLLSCYTSQPQPAMQLLTSWLKYPWIEEGRIGSRVGHDAYVRGLLGPGMLVDQHLIQAAGFDNDEVKPDRYVGMSARRPPRLGPPLISHISNLTFSCGGPEQTGFTDIHSLPASFFNSPVRRDIVSCR